MLNSKPLRVAALVLIALGLKASYIVQPAPASPVFPSTGTPGFVRAVEAHTAATPTSLSVSFGTLPTVGHAVVVGSLTAAGTAANDLGNLVTDNQGNGYARIEVNPIVGNVGRVSFWCTIVATSSGTYTVQMATTGNAQMGIMALEYSGTSCNPDGSAGAAGATSPYSCGNITTRNAKDLLLTFLFVPGSTGTVTFTAPASFTTEVSQVTAASGQTAAIADRIVSATGTFTPTFSASQNLQSPCGFIALMSGGN